MPGLRSTTTQMGLECGGGQRAAAEEGRRKGQDVDGGGRQAAQLLSVLQESAVLVAFPPSSILCFVLAWTPTLRLRPTFALETRVSTGDPHLHSELLWHSCEDETGLGC